MRAAFRHVDEVLDVVDGQNDVRLDAVVRNSWLRSAKAHGLDPASSAPPRIATAREVGISREAVSQLIEVARTELDYLYKLVRPAHYVVLLCDKDGLVVDHRGEDAEASAFRRWGVWLGGVWSEAAEGTNGIGTALTEAQPVNVHRSQHFRARHIDLSCSGAPIFDAEGELVGVLDVSSIDPGLSEHAHALTGALTVATARAIEERLFRGRFRREWILAAGGGGGPNGGMLLALDRELRVVGADRCARAALRLPAVGALVDDIGLWSRFERTDALFQHLDRGDAVGEVKMFGGADAWPAIATPPGRYPAPWSGSGGDEFRLRPRLDALRQGRRGPEPARGGLPPATLGRIRDYVDAHLGETIDLVSLAATADLSVYHFARSFRQSEGITPHAFILERRVAKARELLTSTRLPLSEIALETGFADQSHFARRFRQAVGVSPGQFRKLRN
jgi:AraC-like DNA-binding protein